VFGNGGRRGSSLTVEGKRVVTKNEHTDSGNFTKHSSQTLCTSLVLSVFLLGCASVSEAPVPEPELARATEALLTTPAVSARWEHLVLPAKRSEPFVPTHILGRAALTVQSNSSVSILRQQFGDGLPSVGRLSFSWKVDALPPLADLRDAEAEDAPVRIVLAFDGDRSLLSPRTHRLSELSRLLTGEELPYATLAYVWSAQEPLETVVHNPRTDRIRKLIVETGTQSLGQWRDYQRDVHADFVRAFGEPPGPLLAIALMTDTDNTESALRAWYGRLQLEAVGSRTARP